MRKTFVYLEDEQFTWLRKEAFKNNISMSELMRRLVRLARRKDE